MTSRRRKRWAVALGLAALVVLGAHTAPVAADGTLAALVGAGPIRMTTMLVCGVCVGAGIGMVLSDSWVAALGSMSSWSWIAVCGAACGAVVGLR
jgi:hypothetical protein